MCRNGSRHVAQHDAQVLLRPHITHGSRLVWRQPNVFLKEKEKEEKKKKKKKKEEEDDDDDEHDKT